MALEKDFEILDDYVSNRLNEQERVEFEQKLESDPQLKQEWQLQQGLVEGIRKARMTELKTFLNNIPVSPVQVGQTTTATKIASTVIVAGLITTAVYLYFNQNDSQPAGTTEIPVTEEPSTTPEVKGEEPLTSAVEEPKAEEKTESKTGKAKETPAPVSPKLDVYDPTEEEREQAEKENEQLAIISKAFVTSSIEVVTDNTLRKTNFHYLFKDNKLLLYGSFEKNLYEILEFIGEEKRTVFLFYKSNYYLIDLEKTSPTLLVPIKNEELLRKLKEYRGN